MATRTEPMAPQLAPPTLPRWAEQFIEANGMRTRFFQAGQGPPLLLIPSVFLQAASYRGTIEALAEHFQVTVAEMPGSGLSERVKQPWGFAEGADWAAALLDALNLDRALVVGHSDTGAVAALMGVRHPSRLDGLVMVDSVGGLPGATWWSLLKSRLRDGLMEESRLNLPLTPHMLANLVRHTRNCLYHAFWLAASTEPLEVAPQIEAPTLLAWGRRDYTFPPHCAERFHAAIRDSRIAWSEASHDWLILHPLEFADAVAAFAREQGLLPAGASDAIRDRSRPPCFSPTQPNLY
ncbi:alpha/beta hydrolase [Singulisphaera sp. Ch08]|uniref:Alpha/beta hydrolase n=1 Tax=Singulisphaera sp. Ch08 TaxID=3120278 RepID=A0AAU7C9Z4_9BACT